MTAPLADATSALSNLSLAPRPEPEPNSGGSKGPSAQPARPCVDVSSLACDLGSLSLKSPSKRAAAKRASKHKHKLPVFRYRVGGRGGRSQPPSRPPSREAKETKAKGKHGHVHVRVEPRSRRHAMHRRHRVPSPTPTV